MSAEVDRVRCELGARMSNATTPANEATVSAHMPESARAPGCPERPRCYQQQRDRVHWESPLPWREQRGATFTLHSRVNPRCHPVTVT